MEWVYTTAVTTKVSASGGSRGAYYTEKTPESVSTHPGYLPDSVTNDIYSCSTQYHEEEIMTLPTTITVQDKLLTIDTNTAPILKDVILPGIQVQPLYLNAEEGIWVLRVLFPPGITLPKHFHTGTVHLWTISGAWHYVEYPDQPQTAGCYLYEPGGSIHTFHTPETNTELTDTFMVVTGSNVNYDEDGNLVGIMDAGWIADAVNTAAAEQGVGKAHYIRGNNSGYSDQ